MNLFFFVFTCIVVPVASDSTGCMGEASYPCLPGMDAIGIGYDAVRGTSFGVGRAVVKLNFSKGNAKVWNDPFGNKTTFSYANQARVTQAADQVTQFSIFRSVSDFVSYQQANAHVDASYGMFFKASVDTKWAQSYTNEGLHIVAVTTNELGVYSITLDPPMFMQPDSQFSAYVDALPSEYDADAYNQFIQYYGTHYVSAGTLGGRATMRTIIDHDYYSTQSDASISAQLQVTWKLFGGDAGGGASSNTTDQKWTQNSQSSTHAEGGDPAIKSFSNAEQWTAWAKSVDTSSPVLTSVALEPLWSLFVDGLKRDNMIKAVGVYAANETFPTANLSNYRMDWCDCYPSGTGQPPNPPGFDACAGTGWGNCATSGCTKAGFFQVGSNFHTDAIWTAEPAYYCCRPCFTANN
eukprot:m.456717 g.456717  ORF g.456717 m.456717 type:complete len:408 (+) comp21109_c0_seq1:41-1264(+)